MSMYVSDKNFEFDRTVWNEFELKTMGDYHELCF